MAFKPSRDIEVSSQLAGVERNLELFLGAIKGLTPQVLLEILDPVLEQSRTYCPVKTGTLRNSGYLEVMQEGTGGVISAEVGYGRGGFPSYTIFVHEDMEKYHVPPTQAKFLQRAIDEILPNIEEQILRKYKQGIKLS
jgi:hypothetical protein